MVASHDNSNMNLISLTPEEMDKIKEILGREPEHLELEIFSKLWSEHATYKNSIKWLKELPRKGDNVLIEAGEESSGAIDIGDDIACVFKVESHNHPCAIQPRLGASTGLRVVTRDIMAMGAKPVAFLDSLRFGEGKRDTAKWLFEEVSVGLSEFEKGFRVPVIGGETFFDKGFNSSPVVNNMAVGVVKKDKLVRGVARGKGNKIAVIGAVTGNDGIDTDAFTADVINNIETKQLMLDQMMDVSIETKLLSAIQKFVDTQCVVGIQTIGDQGLIGAAVEMTQRGKSGMNIYTDKINSREDASNAREKLLSETWGRILVCFNPDDEPVIEKIVKVDGLPFAVIGEVTDENIIRCYEGDNVVAEIPVDYVGLGEKSPVYEREYEKPDKKITDIDIDSYPEPDHYPDVVKKMMKSMNVASKKWLCDMFDKTLRKEGSNQKYPSDAGFIELDGTGKSLAVTMDCNPNYMKADANKGTQIAVAEAMRNIVCAGGNPAAVSDCLNFGNPYNKEVYGEFVETIKGLAHACKYYNVPVISGNVSFYNQHSVEGQVKAVIPSPVIGMVGVVENKMHYTTVSFRHKGDMIFLVGKSRNDVNSSEYAVNILNIYESAPPYYDEEEEKELQMVVKGLINNGLVRSAHDVSNGGLFFTLLESAVPLEFGFDITSDAEIRKEAFLFGEAQGRVVVSVSPEKQDDFVDFMVDAGFPFSILGHVTKGELRIDDESYGDIRDLKKQFEGRLKQWLNEESFNA
ncbi:MAG: phosphoribosylformylglycinamidine synthase subunit PurL [Chlorobi bacterium]|nr:phosphoribosylformylglycinamidine synthase subunit PurL [Chlorobiota bacterium]